MALTGKRPPKKTLEAAVRASQLYAGSMSCRIGDQQKLHTRLSKLAERLSTITGLDVGDVLQQVGREARRRGPICPMPGKDI